MSRRKRFDGSDTAAAAPQSASDTTVGVPDPDRIAMRAYELYLARGAGDGADMDDWLNAERELANGGQRRDE
jgi:hypothetical protein